MSLRNVIPVILAFGACFNFAHCGGSPQSERARTLRLVEDTEPDSLDPAKATSVAQYLLCGLIYEGLVKFGPGTEIVPALAERWEITDDGLTYTFHLRLGAHFHDGSPLDSADARYSFQRLLDPRNGLLRAWIFDNVAGAAEYSRGASAAVGGFETPEAQTFIIRLKKPYVPFLTLLAMPNAAILPDKIYETQSAPEKIRGGGLSVCVGAGPWIVAEWERGQHVLLKANADYYGSKPKLDALHLRFIAEPNTQEAEFRAGNLDFYKIPGRQVQKWTASEKWRGLVVEVPELNTYFLAFNCEKPKLHDPAVRRALTRAVNVPAIFEHVQFKQGTPATGPCPPGLAGYQARAQWQASAYNPEQAAAELRALNAEQLELEIWQYEEELAALIVQAVKSDLEKIGVSVRVRKTDKAAFRQAVRNGAPDLYYSNWWADYPDIENFLLPCFHSRNWGGKGNGSRYKNERVDQLLDQALYAADARRRLELLRQAENLIRDDAPWIFLWHRKSHLVHQPRVKNFRPYAVFYANQLLAVDLEDQPSQY